MTRLDSPAVAPVTRDRAGRASEASAIRAFRVAISDEAVADLRRRLQATRWPDKETVADASQGAQLANLQELVRYWATEYDWRKGEDRKSTRLNSSHANITYAVFCLKKK